MCRSIFPATFCNRTPRSCAGISRISGVYPLVEDFTKAFTLPPAIAALPRVGFFPGSTIGNFEPHEACKFLRHAGGMLGEGAVFVIGVDLVKDAKILYDAYNDAEGVTAKFNLNLLARINRELGADFNLGAFEHHAFYNSAHNRIEMHLASTRRQKVRLNGTTDRFPRRRDHPHREQLQIYHRLISGAGPRQRLVAAQAWSDGLFAVHALSCDGTRQDG